MVVVHNDAQTRDTYIHDPNSPIRRHFTRLAKCGLLKGGDIENAMKQLVIAGCARKVTDDILALQEAVGTFGTLNLIDPAGSDATMTRLTMINLAQDVVPSVTTSDVSHTKNLEKI